MLVGIKNDRITGRTAEYIIETPEGERFSIKTGWTHVKVPTRDGTGRTKGALFDMESLFLKGHVRTGTTADEAFAAMKLIREMPRCLETSRAVFVIKKYLDSCREQRRDQSIAVMTELYGAEVATKLSRGYRDKAFRFPGYYLRETGFAKVVCDLIDQWSGLSVMVYKTPRTFEQAIHACYNSKGSKCAVWMRKTLESNLVAEDRIGPIFDTVRYIESTR